MAKREKTMAHDFADRRGGDGQIWEPEIEETDAEVVAHAPGEVRWEFPDGSVIIEMTSAWDLGIHRDRLDEAKAQEVLAGIDLDFAFIGGVDHLIEDAEDWTYPK